MTLAITVKVKNVYGNECIYPVCEQAKLFASIAGQKTLNNSISQIKKLGYQINVETPTL